MLNFNEFGCTTTFQVVGGKNSHPFVYVSKLAQKTSFRHFYEMQELSKIVSFFRFFLNINKMKIRVPNQIFNQPGAYLPRQTTPLSMKKLIMFLIVLMCTSTIFAQGIGSRETSQILEKQAFLASMNSGSTGSTRNANADPRLATLHSLLDDVNTAIYYYGGTSRVYGDRPECLYTDVASFGGLRSANIDVSNVKMLTIKVSSAAQLANSIDLSILSSFPQLRYVYIISEVEASGNQIIRMVRNAGAGYSIFYSVQKAS